jgi:hypothetical protein
VACIEQDLILDRTFDQPLQCLSVRKRTEFVGATDDCEYGSVRDATKNILRCDQ